MLCLSLGNQLHSSRARGYQSQTKRKEHPTTRPRNICLYHLRLLSSLFPMAFAPTFGSFGDFITLVVLVRDAYSALSESAGSPHEYQNLMNELDELADVVRQLSDASVTLKPEVARAVERRLVECCASLCQFNRRLQRHSTFAATSSITRSDWRRIQRALLKLKWKLVVSSDVGKIQSVIMSHKTSFILLLTIGVQYEIPFFLSVAIELNDLKHFLDRMYTT